VKIVVKPLKMENGANFKVEKVSVKAHLSLTIQIWDGTQRRCGIVVSPTATLKEIRDQAQLEIADENLEEEQVYAILHNGTPASQPWIQKEYELRPLANARGLGVVKGRFGEMTIPLPLFQKNRWDQIIRNSLPEPPAAIIQEEQMNFRVYYTDEEVTHHVRFVTDDMGEGHLVDLLPQWENQVHKVRQAFGREMVPDISRQSKDNIIYVKSKDGSPPNPTFERTMKYTLGDGSEEFSVRIHKGQTTQEVMTGLRSLHAGINPSKILFNGSEMANEDPITDWATETGTSPLKVQICLDQPVQRFQVWQNGGIYDLGASKTRNPLLKNIEDYKLFVGQKEYQWNDLSVLNVILVPNSVLMVTRGSEFRIADRHTTSRVRLVGPLTPMKYQIFTIEKNPIGEPVEILAQLVTHFILPSGINLDVGSLFYWNLREIEQAPEEKDKTKRDLEQIPMVIPQGFNLRVKCNTLRDAARKKMAHVKWGSVKMNFAMDPNDTMRRLKERVAMAKSERSRFRADD
jgi:hypothetical protein